MPAASPSLHEYMNQRLALLGELAGSLELARAALAATTAVKLDSHTVRQQELCRELRTLDRSFFAEAPDSRPSGLADDLQAAVRRVAELNRKYAALLRRRRRTVDIFCRVLASSGTTYPAPKLLFQPSGDGARTKG